MGVELTYLFRGDGFTPTKGTILYTLFFDHLWATGPMTLLVHIFPFYRVFLLSRRLRTKSVRMGPKLQRDIVWG